MNQLTYNVVQAAQILGVSRSVLYELLRSGRLRSITIGRRRLVPAQCLEEFVSRELEAA